MSEESEEQTIYWSNFFDVDLDDLYNDKNNRPWIMDPKSPLDYPPKVPNDGCNCMNGYGQTNLIISLQLSVVCTHLGTCRKFIVYSFLTIECYQQKWLSGSSNSYHLIHSKISGVLRNAAFRHNSISIASFLFPVESEVRLGCFL